MDQPYHDLDYLLSDIYDIESKIYRTEIECFKKGFVMKLNLHRLDHCGFNSYYLNTYRGIFELMGTIYNPTKPPFLKRFLRDSACCFQPKFFEDDVFKIKISHRNNLLREKTILIKNSHIDLEFTLSEITGFLFYPEITVELTLLSSGPSRSIKESEEEILNTSKYLNSLLYQSFLEYNKQKNFIYFKNSSGHLLKLIDFNLDYVGNAYKLGLFNFFQLRYIWTYAWMGLFQSPEELLLKAQQDCEISETAGEVYLMILESQNRLLFSEESNFVDKICFFWNNFKKKLKIP